MQSYYAHMNLPEPVVPAPQSYALLKGQTALVTGANSGIGRAIAVALGRAGADVVVNYLVNPEDAEAVAQEIRSVGQRAMTAQATSRTRSRCKPCLPQRCVNSAPSTSLSATPAWSAMHHSTR